MCPPYFPTKFVKIRFYYFESVSFCNVFFYFSRKCLQNRSSNALDQETAKIRRIFHKKKIKLYFACVINFSVHWSTSRRVQKPTKWWFWVFSGIYSYVGRCVRPKRFLAALALNFDFDLLQQIANLSVSMWVFSVFIKPTQPTLRTIYMHRSERPKHIHAHTHTHRR